MSSKCPHCNKIVETTTARRIVSKEIPVTDQKRKNYLKSDFEVVHNLEDGTYCEWCGYIGEEDEFLDVPPEEKTEIEETAFDKGSHYRNWLDWIEHIKKLVKEDGEKNYVRKQASTNT